MTFSPIALFAYNRPDHLRATIRCLAADQLASKSQLFIFSDGEKNEKAKAQVQAVREIARSAEGFHSVEVIERPDNFGLVKSITGGVSDLCKSYGRVIVLEDDLITAPSFLSFMNSALDRYESDQRVMQISGYMYGISPPQDRRASFLPVTSCWGWATWDRAWEAYDASYKGLSELIANPVKARAFNLDGAYDYLQMLKDHRDGRLNSWGVVWYLSAFMRGGLTLYPPVSLVSNVGFDGSGTHQSLLRSDDLGRVVLDNNSYFKWPNEVSPDKVVYTETKQKILRSHKGVRHQLNRILRALTIKG